MVEYGFVRENIVRVQERIQAAASRAGRNAGDISLLAVTKFHPAEAAVVAYSCGIRRFGENRVQEALSKYSPELKRSMPDSRLDMIGTLQGNKVNKALKVFDSIQSVDSVELLEAIILRSAGRSEPLSIFLELHTGEESKSGFPDLDELFRAAESYSRLCLDSGRPKAGMPGPQAPAGNIALVGLMTMAPFTSDTGLVRKSFKSLVRAFNEIQKRFLLPGFRELSMGMSNDFEIAVEEGSTILRIGTAIFGARP